MCTWNGRLLREGLAARWHAADRRRPPRRARVHRLAGGLHRPPGRGFGGAGTAVAGRDGRLLLAGTERGVAGRPARPGDLLLRRRRHHHRCPSRVRHPDAGERRRAAPPTLTLPGRSSPALLRTPHHRRRPPPRAPGRRAGSRRYGRTRTAALQVTLRTPGTLRLSLDLAAP